MQVTFLGIDGNRHLTRYTADVLEVADKLIFVDATSPNTTVELTLGTDSLIIRRFGEVEMEMSFKQGQKSFGKYANNLGLAFDFSIYCQILEIKSNKILIDYELTIEEQEAAYHKIALIFK